MASPTEAFEAFFTYQRQRGQRQRGIYYKKAMFEAWLSACVWQKERDAEVAEDEMYDWCEMDGVPDKKPCPNGTLIATAIRSQNAH